MKMSNENINLEPVDHTYWCASITQMLLSDPPQKAPCDCRFERRKLGDIYADTPSAEKERGANNNDAFSVPDTVMARIAIPIVDDPQTISFFEKSEIGYLYKLVHNFPDVNKMAEHFKTMPDILQPEMFVRGYPVRVFQSTGTTVELLEDTVLFSRNCVIPVKMFDKSGNVVFERILISSQNVVWNSNNVKTKVI